MNKGIWSGAVAYALWGVLPVFWKSIAHVPAQETLAHRMVWSQLFLILALAVRRDWRWLLPLRRQPGLLRYYVATAALLSLNWGTYIWAVNAGFIVEASLGYFINPLVNVLLGMLFLGERLRPWQKVAIVAAGLGVSYLTWRYGRLPWIALTLALTFGFYGLLRKRAPLSSLHGLTVETALLFLPALLFLGCLQVGGTAVFLHAPWPTDLLVPMAGLATALPLLLFGVAVRRVTLTTLGILQYLTPTGQFLIGVFIYREPFRPDNLIGYGLIWLALIIYTMERSMHANQRRDGPRATPLPAPVARHVDE